MKLPIPALTLILLLPAAGTASEYLGNPQRTGDAGCTIPSRPVLQWTYHERHAPRHAWKQPGREVQYIDFDYADQCTLDGSTVYFGSAADHAVRALDVRTGRERWVFYTGGPVRFAPSVWNGRVYVASDDGLIYCLRAVDGAELWRYRPGRGRTMCIGNEQLVSRWPARSGVLIDIEGMPPGRARLFCTGGMWSRDGVVIACLDALAGRVLWKNDTSDFHYMAMPHSAGFGGVAPQGYLVRYKDMLYVAAGRAEPAFFNANTGELVHHETGVGYKPHYPGGSWVMAAYDRVWFKRRQNHIEEAVRYEERDPGPSYASGLMAWHYATGEPEMALTDKNLAAVRGDTMILAGNGPVIRVSYARLQREYGKYWRDGKVIAMDPHLRDPDVPFISGKMKKLKQQLSPAGARRGKGKTRKTPVPSPNWMTPVPFAEWQADVGRVYSLMLAGDRVLVGGRKSITLLDFDSGKVLWRRDIPGNARGLAVESGRFVVSSSDGTLYCFGEGQSDSAADIRHTPSGPPTTPADTATAKSILANSGIRNGYCIQLGAGSGGLAVELARNSDLVVYCLEPDAAKIASLRRQLDQAGLLGVRVQVVQGGFDQLPFNPYLANLVVCGGRLGSPPSLIGTRAAKPGAAELRRIVRPWGGVAYCLADGDTESIRRWLISGGVPSGEIATGARGVLLRRGPLKGAGEWTHADANIGRTRSSDDDLVRLPLSMLWWGGPGPRRIVSRHWRAPVPLFSQGRMFIQGQHDVFAVDAYNGRELWNRHIEGVGRFPPSYRGGNIVTDGERVYCVKGLRCMALDAATGDTVREYVIDLTDAERAALRALAESQFGPGKETEPVWEYLAVTGNRVIGTVSVEPTGAVSNAMRSIPYQSPVVFAFDRNTGKRVWLQQLDRVVAPAAIASDGRLLFVLDRTEENAYREMRRRGGLKGFTSVLKAFDLETGGLKWQSPGIDPERKSLLCKHGVVVALPASEEPGGSLQHTGLLALRCSDGARLWEHADIGVTGGIRRSAHIRHAFAAGDMLFLPRAFDLRTGQERLPKRDPLTAAKMPVSLSGQNFCGTVAASLHLTAYRSASIGFEELDRDSGSFWFPEVRPSCWISVIPAGGIVLAPEGYSTCVCSYNYKTSLALFHEPRFEDWSIYLEGGVIDMRRPNQRGKRPTGKGPVRILRLNFNAPGDKLDADNQQWLTTPEPWRDQPKRYLMRQLPVSYDREPAGFLFDADTADVTGTDKPWLYTSGITGAVKLTVNVGNAAGLRYNLRLHFTEPLGAREGERVFDVRIQGQPVLQRLDIYRQAGGANTALVREVRGIIPANDAVTLELVPVSGKPPLLCALELTAALPPGK